MQYTVNAVNSSCTNKNSIDIEHSRRPLWLKCFTFVHCQHVIHHVLIMHTVAWGSTTGCIIVGHSYQCHKGQMLTVGNGRPTDSHPSCYRASPRWSPFSIWVCTVLHWGVSTLVPCIDNHLSWHIVIHIYVVWCMYSCTELRHGQQTKVTSIRFRQDAV